MHFSHLALVFLPFALGRLHHGVSPGLRHRGGAKDIKGMPRRGDTPAARAFGRARHGGRPGHHRRVQQTKTTPPPDDTTAAPQETVAPGAECGDGNPFSKQVSGCPCFNLETITGKIDLNTAEYCDYYAEDDPSLLYQYTDFSASPPITSGKSTSIYFSIYNDTEPGYEGRFCQSSIDYFASDETGETGEDHWYYLSVEMTEEEYADCDKVLNTLKDQLPANCNIY